MSETFEQFIKKNSNCDFCPRYNECTLVRKTVRAKEEKRYQRGQLFEIGGVVYLLGFASEPFSGKAIVYLVDVYDSDTPLDTGKAFNGWIEKEEGKSYITEAQLSELSYGMKATPIKGKIVIEKEEEEEREKTYSIGNIFESSDKKLYILSICDSSPDEDGVSFYVSLVSFSGGKMYYNAIKVSDISNITLKEFSRICDGNEEEFNFLGKDFKIVKCEDEKKNDKQDGYAFEFATTDARYV